MTIKTLSYAALAERLKCGLETARSLVTGEVATLKARIESLQAELFKLEATAARHRADYERERDRADRLVSELLKVTTNTSGHRPVTRGRLLTYALLIKRLATVGLDPRDLAEFQTPTRPCSAGLEQRAHHRGADRTGPAGDDNMAIVVVVGARTYAVGGVLVTCRRCWPAGTVVAEGWSFRLVGDGVRKGDAPDFVEVGEAGIAGDDAMRRQCRVQLVG